MGPGRSRELREGQHLPLELPVGAPDDFTSSRETLELIRSCYALPNDMREKELDLLRALRREVEAPRPEKPAGW
jgi:hypothetical protein